ncbi:MAG: STAS domain-containing protein [Candidatus Omnitrophica bacterium]|nr:STAS domain-containing protein [Candidatus Omnitrophota bacterium]MCF7893335.1 STAS domain-containing protein [Candidatus Omnitrophota bacterium]
MKISEDKKNDIMAVSVSGEINIDTSPDLRKAFDQYAKQGIKKVIIDCANLTYIDSSGLATLIELMQRLKKIKGELKICNLAEKVKSVFEVTKLDKLFDICSNQEQAVERFK